MEIRNIPARPRYKKTNLKPLFAQYAKGGTHACGRPDYSKQPLCTERSGSIEAERRHPRMGPAPIIQSNFCAQSANKRGTQNPETRANQGATDKDQQARNPKPRNPSRPRGRSTRTNKRRTSGQGTQADQGKRLVPIILQKWAPTASFNPWIKCKLIAKYLSSLFVDKWTGSAPVDWGQ